MMLWVIGMSLLLVTATHPSRAVLMQAHAQAGQRSSVQGISIDAGHIDYGLWPL